MPGKQWTPEEIEFIRKGSETMSSKEVAAKMLRSTRSVRDKATREGIFFRIRQYEDGSVHRYWTREEVLDLMTFCEKESSALVAHRLKRTVKSVLCKAQSLGLSFTEGRLDLNGVAEILGVVPTTVRRRRNKLKLRFRVRADTVQVRVENMRGAIGSDIVAIARDILNDPPQKGLKNTSAKKLRAVIEEYEGWLG